MLFIIAICVLIGLLYLYGTQSYNYWKDKGVKYEKPLPFIGNAAPLFAHRVSVTTYITELYRKYPAEKYVGFYVASKTALLVKDIDLIKQVLVADFLHFYPRGLNSHDEVIEPMLKNLFFADGDLWKLLRQRLTPAFTSGKLKAMFPLIVEKTERLQHMARAGAAKGAELDVRDLMARYTTDFIGACGFGIDTDSINDKNSMFRKLGKRLFNLTPRDGIVGALKWCAPNLLKNVHALAPEIEKTTVSLVKGILELRNYIPSGRNDFIDLLLELKQKGKIVGESLEKLNSDGKPLTVDLELDDMLMAAQVLVFFAAGFETSSSATSYTLHQLAFHPEAQRKCQQEIDHVLSRYDNKLCYDAVKEMKYLEMCFREGLRMFPPLGFLIRKCSRPYRFPDTNLTIDKDVIIFIPVDAIHNDDKYYKNPDQFDPERFNPENIGNIEKHVYLPFGEGPRVCIGERLGLMQSLAGLAALLGQFTVAPGRSTRQTPLVDPASFIVQNISGGLPLSLTSRKK
ncbi:hypothetical protein MSG28_015012 [Choristoneura fumiferana]|uniref:Uncharacterized protein n=1 Tax=Choristoneura fumiferana TaxID=7141 RepID=A0ACC0KY27_CHOFU|nr:hypothetical protein MSG28_015012 [Choristoneura fumiferana]